MVYGLFPFFEQAREQILFFMLDWDREACVAGPIFSDMANARGFSLALLFNLDFSVQKVKRFTSGNDYLGTLIKIGEES